MSLLNLYFHVHQPYRINRFSVFDIGTEKDYFNNSENLSSNKTIFKKVSEKCYLPANKLILELLNFHPEFKVSFSITSTFIEQAKEFFPEVLESFKKIFQTGRAELVAETSVHSLAFLYSKKEFKNQIKEHIKTLESEFKITPKTFRNTELIFREELSGIAFELGFDTVLIEGVDRILGWRSPNFLYSNSENKKFKLLLKNYKLSDDIAFRFSNPDWEEYPLTADKFTRWLETLSGNSDVINLFMDYETFGEHQWEHTGIFNFLKMLPFNILQTKKIFFTTPFEASKSLKPKDSLFIKEYISWADAERDTSAWNGNAMQKEALDKCFDLEKNVLSTKDPQLLKIWRRLQTSDHFYYMCTKWFSDGDVHKYFSPFETPYDAFISYINILEDFRAKVLKKYNLKNKS